MTSGGSEQQQPSAGSGVLPSIPAMPNRSAATVYRGRPQLVLELDVRHSIGWQDRRRTGPGFVVARVGRVDRIVILERFPFTQQGWEDAWRALSGLDPAAAAAVSAKLAERDANRRSAAAVSELDRASLCLLRRVAFSGGSGNVPLVKDAVYDLRFLGDRILVCPVRSADALVDIAYADVETLEIGGPGRVSKAAGDVVAWTLGLALVGAVLGLIVLGVLGLFLGAVLFGLFGALGTAAASKIETIVRIRSADAELYFTSSEKLPDALRTEVSGAQAAIDKARAASTRDREQVADLDAGSIPDQLTKLASLLDQGVLTRDEFEVLKANLIAKA